MTTVVRSAVVYYYYSYSTVYYYSYSSTLVVHSLFAGDGNHKTTMYRGYGAKRALGTSNAVK